MNTSNGVDGEYLWACHKVDRKVDPYMGVVINPLNYTYTGLFATMGKARSWTRETIKRDRLEPREPST